VKTLFIIAAFGSLALTCCSTVSKTERTPSSYDDYDCVRHPCNPHENADEYALFEALRAADRKEVERLAHKGVNLEVISTTQEHGAELHDGQTPLTFAVKNNKVSMVVALVELGAKVNQYDGYNQTPLIYAVRWNNADAVVRLLCLGASRLDRDKQAGRNSLEWAEAASDDMHALLTKSHEQLKNDYWPELEREEHIKCIDK